MKTKTTDMKQGMWWRKDGRCTQLSKDARCPKCPSGQSGKPYCEEHKFVSIKWLHGQLEFLKLDSVELSSTEEECKRT
jgi:hypothetical protein